MPRTDEIVAATAADMERAYRSACAVTGESAIGSGAYNRALGSSDYIDRPTRFSLGTTPDLERTVLELQTHTETLLATVAELRERLDKVEGENQVLNEKLEQLWNAPGGPGYEEARADFTTKTIPQCGCKVIGSTPGVRWEGANAFCADCSGWVYQPPTAERALMRDLCIR